MKKQMMYGLIVIISLLFFSSSLYAQDEEEGVEAATEETQAVPNMHEELAQRYTERELQQLLRDPELIGEVPEKLRTPRNTVANFLAECEEGEYEKAARYLDFSLFTQERQQEIASSYTRQLYLVLRNVKVIDLAEIPDNPRGTLMKKLYELGEEHFVPVEIIVTTEEMEAAGLSPRTDAEEAFLNLALVRSDHPGHLGEWKFSKYNVRDIPFWYDQIGYGVVGKFLPTFMIEIEFLSIQLWQYIALLLIIFIGLLLNKLVRFFLSRKLKTWERISKLEFGSKLLNQITSPIGFLLMSLMYALIIPYLLFTAEIYNILINIVKGMATFGVVWFLYRIVDFIGEYLEKLTLKTESTLDDQLVPLVRKTLKVFVILIGVIFGLQNFNVDVWGFMAGMGIGGIAFALAAKDTLSNLFGSMMIFTDRPFQVGSWIKVGEVEGIVEEVGFRTTRVRTFAQSLVSIPNSVLTTTPIEHVTARNRQRIYGHIPLTYDTAPQDIQWLVEEIKKLIQSNEKFYQDYYQICFSELGEYALKIMLYCFVYSTDWGVFLQERQWFLLEIMKKCQERGIKLAIPEQNVFVKSFPTSPMPSSFIDKK